MNSIQHSIVTPQEAEAMNAWESNASSTASPPLNSERTAGLMRWLGALAVAASAIVYMLQGLANIDLELRNWVYLALMALMAGCGVASSKLLQDAKSTRLFFGLAALLVPVQFSQLGGLLHEMATVPDTIVPHLGWLVLGTGALALPVAYAAMAILARPNRRALCFGLLAVSAALLIPARASMSGFLVLAAITSAVFFLQLKVLGRSKSTGSWEDKGIRLLLSAPAIIAGARMSMHVDSAAGIAAMGGLAAIVIIQAGAHNMIMRLAGAVLGFGSWLAYASEALPLTVNGPWAMSILCLPASIWLTYIARFATADARLYRAVASLLIALCAGSVLLLEHTSVSTTAMQLVALTYGIGAMAWGVYNNHREPTFTGALITVVTLLAMVATAVGSIEASSWVVLGLAGIALVFGASVLEKYGRRLAGGSQRAWREVCSW